MLGRFPVRAVPGLVVGGFDLPTTIEVVSMTNAGPNTPAGLVWLANSEKQATASTGYPLEPGTKVEVDLAPGEELWAIASTTAMLGYSVKGWRGSI